MEKLSVELVVQITMFLTLVGGFIAIIKFLFGLKDEISDLRVEMKELKIEMKDALSKLSMRVERVEMKFDGIEMEQKKIEQTVNKIQEVQISTVNNRVEKIEEDIKITNRETNNLMNKVLEFLSNVPKPAL